MLTWHVMPLPTQADEELAQRLAGWSERYPDVVVHRKVVVRTTPLGDCLRSLRRRSTCGRQPGRGDSRAFFLVR